MPKNFAFKSFYWSVGTTSFRMKEFNRNIEVQLGFMQEFRSRPENVGIAWQGNNQFQAKYYSFLQEKGFVVGQATRPAKDARQKTSGLVDIGLLDEDRNITDVGLALLNIVENNDFDSDNLLEIPKDSHIYLKQLLKTSCNIDGKIVRPFIVLLVTIIRYNQNDTENTQTKL